MADIATSRVLDETKLSYGNSVYRAILFEEHLLYDLVKAELNEDEGSEDEAESSEEIEYVVVRLTHACHRIPCVFRVRNWFLHCKTCASYQPSLP